MDRPKGNDASIPILVALLVVIIAVAIVVGSGCEARVHYSSKPTPAGEVDPAQADHLDAAAARSIVKQAGRNQVALAGMKKWFTCRVRVIGIDPPNQVTGVLVSDPDVGVGLYMDRGIEALEVGREATLMGMVTTGLETDDIDAMRGRLIVMRHGRVLDAPDPGH